MRLVRGIIFSVAAFSGFVVGIAIFLARLVVLPSRPETILVHTVSEDCVEIDREPKTVAVGEFGLWLNNNKTHIKVGAVVNENLQTARVQREILAVIGVSPKPGVGRWTGHVFPNPQTLDPQVQEIMLEVENGKAPAWVFPAKHTNSTIWAVHVHGINTTRITVLRSVPLAQEQGYTSIVPSFRGDGEGPKVAGDASTLGQFEWHDVEVALAYAISHGATRFVLFGWSMGGQVALQLAELSAYREQIVGLVLIAPATDWRSIIRNGAMRAKLPAFVGCLAEWALGDRLLSRFVGLGSPLNLAALDWVSSPRVLHPCLVVHSVGDRQVPFSLTKRFEKINSGTVEVVAFPATEHAWEYNFDPIKFQLVVTNWLNRIIVCN